MKFCNLQRLQHNNQRQVHHQRKISSQVIGLNVPSSLSIIYHLDHAFTQTTTTSSSNDANWGAFVETTKHPTPVVTHAPTTNTMSMPANSFAHPPPEPVRYFRNSFVRSFTSVIFRRINMLLSQNYSVLKIPYKIINHLYSEIPLTEVEINLHSNNQKNQYSDN